MARRPFAVGTVTARHFSGSSKNRIYIYITGGGVAGMAVTFMRFIDVAHEGLKRKQVASNWLFIGTGRERNRNRLKCTRKLMFLQIVLFSL